MTCKQCGAACQGRLCKFHEREQSRDGDWQDQLSQHRTDGGRSLSAELETMAGSHANDALAAMDAQDYQDADYHARQMLQAIIGLNSTGDA